jgi:RalA-binding protein 1
MAIMALPQLDQQVKQLSTFAFRLPERSIFTGHSPAKIDARRAALNSYFQALLATPMDEPAALIVCQFLTADAIEPRDDETSLVNAAHDLKPTVALGPDGKPKMEGYLTKRGKNFGGWKSRYFVLSGPELKYFESPGGAHMGTIKIRHAQIGKQSSSSNKNQSPSRNEEDAENQYRHAFLILEPKKKDSNALVRHVLCAESDAERDAWVEALLSYVDENAPDEESASQGQGQNSKSESQSKQQQQHQQQQQQQQQTGGTKSRGSRKDHLVSEPEQGQAIRAVGYDDVVAAEAPIMGDTVSSAPHGGTRTGSVVESSSHLHAPMHDQHPPLSPTHRMISGPTNGTKIQDAGAWGNKTPTNKKSRSIWGPFRASAFVEPSSGVVRHDSVGSGHAGSIERRDPVRAVFGLPLAEAVEYCGPRGVESGLPAVVYRCIQYLRAQHAEEEEGIFRLSGSNVIIKALKERFNNEGDLDFLVGDEYYDVHAVASLFKQYLRELPTTVLTRELHLDFIHVLGMFFRFFLRRNRTD